MNVHLLPPQRDEAMGVLRRIVTFTMFLSGLLIAMILVTSYFIEGVRFELAGHVTAQVRTALPLNEVDDETKNHVRQLVMNVEGVQNVSILNLEEVKSLMSPWLKGGVEFLDELPLPLILDVSVERDRFDPDDLQAVLVQKGYEASVDDHLLWFARHYGLLNQLHILLLALMGVIFIALLLVAIQTARASLALNEETVSVLRIIGGTDGVVARAFAVHTLIVTIRSCMVGIFWAVLILVAIIYLDDSERLHSLPQRLFYLFGNSMLFLSGFTALATMATTWLASRSMMRRYP